MEWKIEVVRLELNLEKANFTRHYSISGQDLKTSLHPKVPVRTLNTFVAEV